MQDAELAQTRVAILASSDKHQQRLRSLLEAAGLVVVVSETVAEGLPQLEQQAVDVLLVDLSEEVESEMALIDALLENDSLPIMFNDSSPKGGGADALWAKKLARKLAALAQPPAVPAPSQAATSTEVMASDAEPSSQAPTPTPGMAEDMAENIWVLGASLGGPQAVRQFLAAVEADLPVAFILAQHIGANHIALLAEQLDRVTKFKVLAGSSGHRLRHHEVVLAPADKLLSVTEDGYIALAPAPPRMIYSPSIDNVMSAIAERYGQKAGTIVFSGMGDDGAKGCMDIAKHGGVVWAQDVESCVISSMPDQARKTSCVTFSANPQDLARHLYEYYVAP
jgi:chemosensory pili system protein ChpB (putative protein-glutamate methylesterase)